MRRIIFAIIVIVSLAGCKRQAKTEQPVFPETPLQALQQVYGPLSDTYQEWADVYMPLTLSLQSPINQSVSGRVSMRRGEWIHMSLRVLGMEVGALLIDNEQVWVVDKMRHAYVHESLEALLAKYPLTVSDVQDCLLGQLFPPTRDIITDNIEAAVTDQDPPALQSLILSKGDDRYVQVSYDGHAQSPAGIVASALVLNAVGLGKPIAGRIGWRLDKAEWNTNRELKFAEPNDTYKRIDAAKYLSSKD